MNDEELRSDWEALTEQEKEEVLNAFKCAFDAVKCATMLLVETVMKVMPDLSNADTNDLRCSNIDEEGVL